ncbi:MAG: C40 family peptidase [Clostridia bacterium]|nr:C40 family peptidase [Clostridia bacterium]
MKFIQKTAAFLLAVSLLTPIAVLAACEKNDFSTSENSTAIESVDTSLSQNSSEDSSFSQSSEDSSQTESSSSTKPDSSEKDSSSSSAVVTPEPSAVDYIRCTGDSVNIRSGAGTSYTVLGSAEKNTRYAVVGKSGNWYKTYYRGKTAYINAQYAAVFSLEPSDNSKVEKVLQEGYKLLGVPYVYGAVRFHDGNGKLLAGFSAQKFDCSSLVQYIFYKGAGKVLQVHTRSQVLQGKAVKRSDLQRGDCLFFTNESRKHLTGIERIGHVAVYLGDNYILHTASDYARIEQISSSRWANFIQARRFL